MDLDFFAASNMDASVVLNYPTGMSGVLSAVKDILIARGKYIIEELDMSVARATEIVKSATGDTKAYYMITTTSTKVWSILRGAVNDDTIRVLAVFHGNVPEDMPENVISLDVGSLIHSHINKAVVHKIVSAMETKGRYPSGQMEEFYYGLMGLCFEVLYKTERKMFPQKIINNIPTSVAFNFMYNPPEVLTDQSMRQAVYSFLGRVYEWME